MPFRFFHLTACLGIGPKTVPDTRSICCGAVNINIQLSSHQDTASVLSYSDFAYTFDVLSPSSYLFMGSGSSLRNVSDAMEAMVYADVYGTLRDLTNSTYLHSFSVGQDSSASFNYSGTLQPSRYSVYMSAQADVYPDYNEQFVDATASFQMQLKLAPSGTTIPVPEPKSVLLLLIGFAFLTRSARR